MTWHFLSLSSSSFFFLLGSCVPCASASPHAWLINPLPSDKSELMWLFRSCVRASVRDCCCLPLSLSPSLCSHPPLLPLPLPLLHSFFYHSPPSPSQILSYWLLFSFYLACLLFFYFFSFLAHYLSLSIYLFPDSSPSCFLFAEFTFCLVPFFLSSLLCSFILSLVCSFLLSFTFFLLFCLFTFLFFLSCTFLLFFWFPL